MNWYNYVGSDPINFTDPTGLCSVTQFAHFTHFVNPDGTLELKSFDGFSYVPDGCSFADIGLGSPSTNGLLEMAFANAAEDGDDLVGDCGEGAVHLDANFVSGAIMSGKAGFFGTIENLDSGRKLSFSSPVTLDLESGTVFGVAAGHFSVTGTLSGLENFVGSDNIGIAFATFGFKYFGVGSASIQNQNGFLGRIDFGATLAVPISAGVVHFGQPTFKVENEGMCPQ